MSNEKTISNIKKAIKEHLDNNYKYDMLVDFELDVIDWNSLLEYINELQQENKQLKEVIDNIAKCFSDGHFEDGCDCLIIEKYIDSYLKEVSE